MLIHGKGPIVNTFGSTKGYATINWTGAEYSGGRTLEELKAWVDQVSVINSLATRISNLLISLLVSFSCLCMAGSCGEPAGILRQRALEIKSSSHHSASCARKIERPPPINIEFDRSCLGHTALALCLFSCWSGSHDWRCHWSLLQYEGTRASDMILVYQ